MAACTAISAFVPSIVSKSIFAPRRADKSLEADNTAAGFLNAGIATMQLSKLGEGVAAVANSTSGGINNSLKGLIGSESIFSDINKATNFLTKYVSINGFIGMVALANTLADEDKESALIENGSMFGGMLAFEGAHKLLCGTTKTVNGKVEEVEGLYKRSKILSNGVDAFKAICKKQEEALKDCGEVKKFVGKMMKYIPSGAKGLSFAGVSVFGSAICYNTAKKITGRNKANFITLKPKQENNDSNNEIRDDA